MKCLLLTLAVLLATLLGFALYLWSLFGSL